MWYVCYISHQIHDYGCVMNDYIKLYTTEEERRHSHPIAMMAMRWKFFRIHDRCVRRIDGNHITNSYRRSSDAVPPRDGVFFHQDLFGEGRMFYVPSTKDVRRMLFLIICREIKCAQVFHVNNKKLNKRWCWLIIIIDRASQ